MKQIERLRDDLEYEDSDDEAVLEQRVESWPDASVDTGVAPAAAVISGCHCKHHSTSLCH